MFKHETRKPDTQAQTHASASEHTRLTPTTSYACMLANRLLVTASIMRVCAGSEGLGKAIAAALARQGLNIILVSRSQDKLDAAAADIRAQHPGVEVVVRCLSVCLSIRLFVDTGSAVALPGDLQPHLQHLQRHLQVPPTLHETHMHQLLTHLSAPLCTCFIRHSYTTQHIQQVRTIASDLSKPANCHKLLQKVADTPVRVLINNAGGGVGKGLAPYW